MLATTEENVLHLFTHTLTCCHYTLMLQDPVWLESAVNAGQLAHAQTINVLHITKKKKRQAQMLNKITHCAWHSQYQLYRDDWEMGIAISCKKSIQVAGGYPPTRSTLTNSTPTRSISHWVNSLTSQSMVCPTLATWDECWRKEGDLLPESFSMAWYLVGIVPIPSNGIHILFLCVWQLFANSTNTHISWSHTVQDREIWGICKRYVGGQYAG